MADTINYGIDLGTTNSAIAKCENDELRIFKNRDNMEVTPSVIRVEKNGSIIVGRRAYQTLFSDPENVAAEFKRWMGQSDNKVFISSGKSLVSEELSAEVIKSLLEDARRQTADSIMAAVITVPAAFGQLQCEATSRAAMLAGLNEAPLLQEPLAASIAYGMKPDARDKRWLVYDLGGGTFDIAIISTRNGQLSVLEHRGDNMLGGKDFDRLIVEKVFWPHLKELFNMPESDKELLSFKKIIQILRVKAEEAKIDLSLSEQVFVNIFDIGNDKDGRPIEAEIEIKRTELNQLIEPFIAQTINLCNQALNDAHLTASDISKIILVGGPTQMPVVREMLSNKFNMPLDFTIDPITVVVRGAAIYASTLPPKKTLTNLTKAESVQVNLAHETVWPDKTCLVAGKIDNLFDNMDHLQILIEAETGHWNSGWFPLNKDYFEIKVHLLENKTNRFWIYLRDDKGNDIKINPDSFSIRHGLTIAELPLPHSIGVEVVKHDGKNEISVIFPRSTPLPAQKTIIYKANKTLNLNNVDDYIAIKIWEGEYPNPASNVFVGALSISAKEIKRSIPEGSDVEINITINTSRCMEVQAFVPLLNQHFTERVYVAKINEPKFVDKIIEINSELDTNFRSLENLTALSSNLCNEKVIKELSDLKESFKELREEHCRIKNQNTVDPDDAKRIVKRSNEICGRLSQIEEEIKSNMRMPFFLNKIQLEKTRTEEVVMKWGGKLEQKQYEILCLETDRQVDREDEKAVEKLISDFESLKWQVLFKQDWFWKELFCSFCEPGVLFINEQEAQKLINSGKEAMINGDGDTLKKVSQELWELQPKSTVESEREKALEAGIRKKLS